MYNTGFYLDILFLLQFEVCFELIQPLGRARRNESSNWIEELWVGKGA